MRGVRNVVAATATLEPQLELEQTRAVMRLFVVFMCFVMVSYTFALPIAAKVLPAGLTSSVLTFPLTLLWFGAAWVLVRRSELPLAFFGVTTHGGGRPAADARVDARRLRRRDAPQACAHRDRRRLRARAPVQPRRAPDPRTTVRSFGWRCCWQPDMPSRPRCRNSSCDPVCRRRSSAALPGRPRVCRASCSSNALFASAHVHLSLNFALVAFFAGLLWGGLFARQRQLVGVSVCHLLVGWFAFLVVGFEPWY